MQDICIVPFGAFGKPISLLGPVRGLGLARDLRGARGGGIDRSLCLPQSLVLHNAACRVEVALSGLSIP